MLKKVDPTNSVLVAYLQHVNPSVETGILLKISGEGSSKKSKKGDDNVVPESPKKQAKSTSPKKIANETEKPKEKVVPDSSRELIPSKSGVFKRLSNFSFKKRTSSEDQSPTIRKPHLNRKGVKVREIPAPVSPSSKKQGVEDMVKHINKKRKK
ncbi:unnamed protein product [Lactuca virosa]|uniref:Uncharacterized protein n=1 Tax=Lactuca virosa TaxID=75947 RepID=A0AAU9N4U6_9ASTR|nr:unnamed protein product [Lactuca virosa]